MPPPIMATDDVRPSLLAHSFADAFVKDRVAVRPFMSPVAGDKEKAVWIRLASAAPRITAEAAEGVFIVMRSFLAPIAGL